MAYGLSGTDCHADPFSLPPQARLIQPDSSSPPHWLAVGCWAAHCSTTCCIREPLQAIPLYRYNRECLVCDILLRKRTKN
eukprot:scaffold59269_cov28-Tisochrysis_lutea.AAC.1